MTADPETQHREPTRIHLLWKGPHTFEDVLSMHGRTDFGIYQVHGPHPISGTDSLLYIGQANDQTFGARFTNPDRQPWGPNDAPWGDNTALLRFFVGRVHPTRYQRDRGAIDDELWGTYIDTAEKLLISAHRSSHEWRVPRPDPGFRRVSGAPYWSRGPEAAAESLQQLTHGLFGA